MRFFSADIIFDGQKFLNKGNTLAIDEKGIIHEIIPIEHRPSVEVEHYKGLLCPGFINTHCHLELSHMRGMLEEHTGLIPFIKGILAKREAAQEVIQQAIQKADAEMYANGIVAVGDISNTDHTFKQKAGSKIYYHTFAEIFNLNPKEAKATFQEGLELMEGLNAHNLVGSLAPHAPYTVSTDLFKLIANFNSKHLNISSIHNQETLAENQFFINKSGLLNDFYKDWGFDTSFFIPTGKKSLPSCFSHLKSHERLLLVHNTISERDDIELAQSQGQEIFWCTNPNANLYIENRLPNFKYFVDANATMTIGSDSLASNWQLSIMEEIKTILKYNPEMKATDLLQWATLNGAKFLGIDDWCGSFEIGKAPGLVHVEVFDVANCSFLPQSKAVRLI